MIKSENGNVYSFFHNQNLRMWLDFWEPKKGRKLNFLEKVTLIWALAAAHLRDRFEYLGGVPHMRLTGKLPVLANSLMLDLQKLVWDFNIVQVCQNKPTPRTVKIGQRIKPGRTLFQLILPLNQPQKLTTCLVSLSSLNSPWPTQWKLEILSCNI